MLRNKMAMVEFMSSCANLLASANIKRNDGLVKRPPDITLCHDIKIKPSGAVLKEKDAAYALRRPLIMCASLFD